MWELSVWTQKLWWSYWSWSLVRKSKRWESTWTYVCNLCNGKQEQFETQLENFTLRFWKIWESQYKPKYYGGKQSHAIMNCASSRCASKVKQLWNQEVCKHWCKGKQCSAEACASVGLGHFLCPGATTRSTSSTSSTSKPHRARKLRAKVTPTPPASAFISSLYLLVGDGISLILPDHHNERATPRPSNTNGLL